MGCAASKGLAPPLTTPGQDDSKKAKKRASEVAEQAKLYEYIQDDFNDTGLKLPPRPKALPDAEKIPDHIMLQMADAGKAKASLEFNNALDFVTELFVDDAPFKDWKDLYRTTTMPAVAENDRWRTDEEFARQRVFGLHPHMIALVEDVVGLMKKIPVPTEVVKSVVGDDATIEKLAESKKLFVCDYVEMDKIRKWFPDERVACAPLAVFYVDSHDQMMPLAIQLFQESSATNPVFSPCPNHTSKGAWLCAKLHVQVADLFLHEVASHLFNTHLLAEGFYLAMMRNLHRSHPISELLRPHFWGTMGVDFDGRNILVAKDAIMPRLLCAGNGGTVGLLATRMESTNVEALFDFPKIVERRGLSHIPHNPYRDDAMALWELINAFVGDILKAAYPKGDADVKADTELQAWIKELTGTLKVSGLSSPMESVEAATNFVAGLVFNQTVNHASVNGPQWDYLGFVPNAPGRFRMPPLEDPKQEVTDTEIAKHLPNFEDSCEQITVVAALAGTPSDGAKYLGEYDPKFMLGLPEALSGLAKYKKGLEDLKKTIDQRNNACKDEFRYEYLHPKNICNSVCM